MNICIIGTGYVGLPTGVGFAELGYNVVCIDKDLEKINTLMVGKTTIYEEGLEKLLKKNLKNEKIKFSTQLKSGVENADIVMIAVGTPPHPKTKEADMQYIYTAAKELAPHLKNYTIIAIKSTVPIGTSDIVEKIIKQENQKANFDVVSLPEFLREGFAVYDFFNPDRIIIGTNAQKPKAIMKELYKPFEQKSSILFVNRKSSETIKYASNAFLAIKIHYINEIANFCEKTGANVIEVATGMGLDSRIGNKFLNPGPGYGGSCFPKDTMAMAYMGKQNNIDLTLVKTAIKGNEKRKKDMAKKVLKSAKNIENPKIAILGLAFKNGTDDCRESPSIDIIKELLEKHARISAYDPKAMEQAKMQLGNSIVYAKNAYDAIKDADVLVILTEWEEFREIDLKKIASIMKSKIIVDCRNMLNIEEATKNGFVYKGVGI